MDQLTPLPELKFGIYRHFKGKEYRLLYIARDEQTLEPVVVYRALYGANEVWVRSFNKFVEVIVADDGTQMPRFKLVQEE